MPSESEDRTRLNPPAIDVDCSTQGSIEVNSYGGIPVSRRKKEQTAANSLGQRFCRCIPVMAIVGISILVSVVTALKRAAIQDVLQEMDPDKSPLRGFLWFLSGCVLIWIGIFIPGSIFVVATGYFFRYKAFLVILPWLLVGISFEFAIGRLIGRRGMDERLRRWFPAEIKYIESLQAAFLSNGIWLSFLIVSVPIPLGLNLMAVGMFTEVKWYWYFTGALGSTLTTFTPLTIIAAEASNLGDALNPNGGIARFIVSICGILLIILVLIMLPVVMRQELAKLNHKSPRDTSDGSNSFSPQHRPLQDPSQPPCIDDVLL